MSEVYVPPTIATDPVDEYEASLMEERAAIMEVDGGLPREEAEEKAKADVHAQLNPPAGELEVGSRFLNQWTESIGRSTDADRTLVLFAAVGLLSAVCHKFFFYAPRETYLNLFLFILGPSSSPRKTTVLDMTLDYLAEVAPDLILPNEFTAEALWVCLAKQSHGIVFSRELNAWLDSILGKDYNRGLATTLGNIYDHTSHTTRHTKIDGSVTIENPVITILGAGVDEYLIRKLKDIDLISGFWPRVTLVRLPHLTGKPYRPPGQFFTEPHILERLRAITAQPGGEIQYGKIISLREKYAAQLERDATAAGNQNLAAAFSRLEWILVKVAALLELADNPTSREIGPDAFSDAVTLVNHIKRDLPEFYGEHRQPDEEDRLATWALGLIKKKDENGQAWVPYRTILQYSHSSAIRLKAALNRLLETEEAEVMPTPPPSTGGKAGVAYRRKQ